MPAYRKLADRGDVRLAFRWSHIRRYYYELAVPRPSPIASEALERIAALYAVKKDIRGRSADEVSNSPATEKPSADRRARSEAARKTCTDQSGQKSNLAEAIRYALSRWEGLTRFIADGRIELGSNTVERSIRNPTT